MKVLIINTWTKIGGSEYITLELARKLNEKGIKADIACCFLDSRKLDVDYKGVKFFTPPKIINKLASKNKYALVLFGFPFLFWTVFRKAKYYDVLNPHNFPSLWVAGLSALVYKNRIVWECNEPYPLPGFLMPIERFFAGKTDKIIVLDEKTREKVKRIYKKSSIVLRAGVDYQRLSQKNQTDINRFLKRFKGPRTFILTVGKIHRMKNQIILVEAIKMLEKKIPDIALIFAGDGSDRERVIGKARELGIRKRIIMLGTVGLEKLINYYSLAFLNCFPALDQTWGLTPFEALCQGTVSIVSNQAGAAEIIKKQKIGFTANPTPADFADKIFYACEHKQSVKEIGDRGRLYVKNNLSWDSFALEYIKIFGK